MVLYPPAEVFASGQSYGDQTVISATLEYFETHADS